MKPKGNQDIFKVGPPTSLRLSRHGVSKFMAMVCIISTSLLSAPGAAEENSRLTSISTVAMEERNFAWAVDAGQTALEPHQFMARAQHLGLRPLVDLLRTRYAVQTRMQQMRARIDEVKASQHERDLPEAAREAAWSRLLQLFEDDFWPLELRTTLTELWFIEVLQRAQKYPSPSNSNYESWMKTSPQFLSPQEWRSWRSSRRERDSGKSSDASSTEARILEIWEAEMVASTKRGRKIKLPHWAKSFSWLRFEDQLVEITSSPHASTAEVFLPDRRGRIEFLSSRYESFALVGPYLTTLPSNYVPKLWWAEPCLFVDRADLSVREQLPESLATFIEFGEIWPVGEQRLWPRCDRLSGGVTENRDLASQAEPGRLAPEPRTWSGLDHEGTSQLQSGSRSWLWVGLAVLAGGLYWHQQSRSAATPGETRPTHREGF